MYSRLSWDRRRPRWGCSFIHNNSQPPIRRVLPAYQQVGCLLPA
jgi:hypothetical protein